MFLHLPTSSIKKYKTPTNHCVGHSLIKTIQVSKLFNRRIIISELGASLNDDDAIDASGITEVQKFNQLLQNYYENKTYQSVKWAKNLKVLLLLKNSSKNKV